MCTRRTESEVLTRGKGTGKPSAPRSLASAEYRRHMICTMRREILLVCATTCVRAHAGSASGTESHRSRDLDLPRDERPTNIRYSVVEFTGLVQVQMSPQGRTLRRHSNRRPDDVQGALGMRSSWALGEQFAASVPKPRWVKTLGWQELEGRGYAARRRLSPLTPPALRLA